MKSLEIPESIRNVILSRGWIPDNDRAEDLLFHMKRFQLLPFVNQ